MALQGQQAEIGKGFGVQGQRGLGLAGEHQEGTAAQHAVLLVDGPMTAHTQDGTADVEQPPW
jgi:hypothetical protein